MFKGADYGAHWLTYDGNHIWAATGNRVVELNPHDGAVVRVIQGSADKLGGDALFVASNGTDVFVGGGLNYLVELKASSGKLVRFIRNANFADDSVTGLVANAGHLWVTDDFNSVVEFSATSGALVRVISGPSYGFDATTAIALNDGEVWVVNQLDNSVTEFPAT